MSLADFLGIKLKFGSKDQSKNLRELISMFASATTMDQKRTLRLYLEMQCRASAFDLVTRELSGIEPQALNAKLVDAPFSRGASLAFEAVQDLLSGE
jgi:hypothetical protein